jgi:hypothetical protein
MALERFLRMRGPAAAALFAVLAAGCESEPEIISKSRAGEAEGRAFASKHRTIEIVDTPSSSSPEIAVRIQEQWFTIERRKKIEEKFKKHGDGKLELVQGSAKETLFARVTDKVETRPAAGVDIVFRVPSTGKEVRTATDETGIARFGVAEFAEEWIEGRDLLVEIRATVSNLENPNALAEIQNRVAEFAKLKEKLGQVLAAKDVEFNESVYVRANTLEAIFERR